MIGGVGAVASNVSQIASSIFQLVTNLLEGTGNHGTDHRSRLIELSSGLKDAGLDLSSLNLGVVLHDSLTIGSEISLLLSDESPDSVVLGKRVETLLNAGPSGSPVAVSVDSSIAIVSSVVVGSIPKSLRQIFYLPVSVIGRSVVSITISVVIVGASSLSRLLRVLAGGNNSS